MKRKLMIIAAIAATVCLLSGCLSTDNIFSSDQTEMGSVSGGKFYNDAGVHLNVTETVDCDDKWKNEKRVIFYFDLLKRSTDESGAYDIRLKQYIPVSVKDLVNKSEAEEEDLGHNPINIGSAWISGGFLNIQYEYTYITKSNLLHTYDLVLDDSKSAENKLYFEMKHNGGDETLDNLKYEDTSIFSTTSAYASFPISKLISASYPTYYLYISWTWHKEDETGLLRETMTNNAQLILNMDI